MRISKYQLPFQKMLADVPLQVIRLRNFQVASAFLPHRHDFYMLLWTTAGTGRHRVQFRELELVPGRVYFTLEGQVHQMLRYPDEGWLILFRSSLFRLFMDRHIGQDIFDPFGNIYYADLNPGAAGIFERLVPLMEQAVAENPFNPILPDYLSILLYQFAILTRPPEYGLHPSESEKLRSLNNLINEHYKQQRYAPFYSEKLGMVTRKLNELTMRSTGRKVHELVTERLFSEAELLLGTTKLTIKEITYELGFIDNAHFALFFKKHKGMTATDFRRSLKMPSTE